MELQRELHHARIACEGCDSARRATVDVPFGKSELGMVQHIEHLPAKFQAATLAEVVEGAGQRKVKIGNAWSAQGVATARAEARRIGSRVGGGVIPAIYRAHTTR